MESQFKITTAEQLKTIIKKCKEDPTFSLQFRNYLSNLVLPVFKSIAGKYAHNFDYQVMCEECVNDIFMYVLNHEEILYTNFSSYIRKRFEFYCINKLIAYGRLKNRITCNFDEMENRDCSLEESIGPDATFVGETYNEIISFMEEKSNIFSFSEKIIISYFYSGYNFNEISDLIGYSYGKTKNVFDGIIVKLKNFYFKSMNKNNK